MIRQPRVCFPGEALRVVGSGRLVVSDRADETLLTCSLGSCICLSLYDPVLQLGGLLHAMLPVSTLSPEQARERPAMYTDTGSVRLLEEMFERGAERQRLQVKVAGAAAIQDEKGLFNIGGRNHAVLRRVLWKNRMLVTAEHVGGNEPRTLRLRLRDGQTTVRVGARQILL